MMFLLKVWQRLSSFDSFSPLTKEERKFLIGSEKSPLIIRDKTFLNKLLNLPQNMEVLAHC